MSDQERLFHLGPKPGAEGEPHPLEVAAHEAAVRINRQLFGQDYEHQANPATMLTPDQVSGIVHVVLDELAKQEVLKLEEKEQ